MITVLRIGHRPERDKRITTHVALVARAFGADEFVLVCDDPGIVENLNSVTERFGGEFSSRIVEGYRGEVKGFRGKAVHLTMYGEKLDDVIDDIRGEDVMIIVGAEKVPGDIYDLADHNVSVGNQPHSEVAALAIFLDRYFRGEQFDREFNGQVKVVPNPRGKTVLDGREF